ncbi:MAG TPA: STAS domain-containing protein [Bryobacteraceae bacterium]|nr:STAS domain-containing protein [Bryobacteraceae bacterium]
MSLEATDGLQIDLRPGLKPDVAVLKVIGPLTIRNFFGFQDATRSNKERVLIVDLAEVPFMDSAALGSALGLHVSCEKNGRKYALVNVSPRLQTLFTVCGVQDVLVTFPTVQEAEAALA